MIVFSCVWAAHDRCTHTCATNVCFCAWLKLRAPAVPVQPWPPAPTNPLLQVISEESIQTVVDMMGLTRPMAIELLANFDGSVEHAVQHWLEFQGGAPG